MLQFFVSVENVYLIYRACPSGKIAGIIMDQLVVHSDISPSSNIHTYALLEY